MDPKENYLRALTYRQPAYVPCPGEDFHAGVQFDGNFRHADWTDAWGVGWRTTLAEFVPFPKVNPLPDLDRLADFRFPNPGDLTVGEEMRATLARTDRQRLFVTGNLTYFLFERAWALTGMDACLLAFHTHPCEMQALMRRIADYNIAVFDRYLELGVDAVGFSEDLGTQKALLMSPRTFRQFLLPEYVRCFAHVLAEGKVVRFHSCGCIEEIATDLASVGVTALNPVQARANDLPRLKQVAVAGGMALEGGVDSHLLTVGTPEQVREETARVLGILAPGGGYALGPDQGMPWPRENWLAMVDTCRELGRYAPAPA
ncbi:MAG: uroporphyrinogen decarboxylase family protein [Anaerolineae bacterium]